MLECIASGWRDIEFTKLANDVVEVHLYDDSFRYGIVRFKHESNDHRLVQVGTRWFSLPEARLYSLRPRRLLRVYAITEPGEHRDPHTFELTRYAIVLDHALADEYVDGWVLKSLAMHRPPGAHLRFNMR